MPPPAPSPAPPLPFPPLPLPALSSVEERLERLRRQVRKLVEETSWASPSSFHHRTHEEGEGGRGGGGSAGDADDVEDKKKLGTDENQGRVANNRRAPANDGGGDGDGDDDHQEEEEEEQQRQRKRSMNIGMMLFGPEPTGSVDEALLRQLREAESELHELAQCMQEEAEELKDEEELDERALEQETEHLQHKLLVLREIQQVQAWLDKAEAAHVDFRSNNVDASSGNSATTSPSSSLEGAVEACKLVVRAKHKLQEVQKQREEEKEREDEPNGDGWEVVDGMLAAMHNSVRRQGLDWQDAADQLWQVELAGSSAAVTNEAGGAVAGAAGAGAAGTGAGGGGAPSSPRQGSLSVRASPEALRTCYSIYHVLDADWRLEQFVRDLLRDLWRDVVGVAMAAPAPAASTPAAPADKPAAAESEFAHQAWTFHEATMPGRKGGVRLEWTVVAVVDTIEEDKDKDVCGNRDARQLDRAMVQWRHRLESYKRLLQFFVERVLVCDPQLVAEVAGPYLFAKPDARPENLNVHMFGLDSRRLGDDHGLILEPLLDLLEDTCLPSTEKALATPDDGGLGGARNVPELLASASAQLEAIVTPFVDSLVRMGLIPPGDGYAKDKLMGLPSRLKQVYVDRCRIRVLDQARMQILNLDFHTTKVVESESFPSSVTGPMGQLQEPLEVFRFPRCAVSITAFESMKLCRRTLQDATAVAQGLRAQLASAESSSPTALWLLSNLPGAMYRSARDVLDLFRNLIPARYGSEVASVPRAAAIFHNDCAYMAHQCLTLGLEYKDLFPTIPSAQQQQSSNPSSDDIGAGASGTKIGAEAQVEASEACALLRQTCTFVDMVPLFRDLAERALGSMLDSHARELVELVQPQIPLLGQALRSNEILQEWSDAESALRGALHHLRRLHQAWKPVLSKDILHGSIWYLSDVVLTLLVDQVGSAKDISTSATQFVSSLFTSASQGMLALTDNDGSASRALDRFQAYGKFMDMSLADIEVALSDGVFRSVTGQELASLISAAFDDSPRRKKLLSLLVSAP